MDKQDCVKSNPALGMVASLLLHVHKKCARYQLIGNLQSGRWRSALDK